MFFKNVIGQQVAKQQLMNMIHQNRLPHALMLTGPHGSGNLQAAIALIAYLYCTNKLTDDACGTCPSCSKTKILLHPDVHFIFPILLHKNIKTSVDVLIEFRESIIQSPYLTLANWVETLDGENKQPIIPTAETNSIISKLAYTSYEGGYKTVLIWCPEKMNTEATNKLLKSIEEPPEKTLFILVCHQIEYIIPTLLSRVQQITFPKLNPQEVTQGLINQYRCPPQQAQQISLLCEGNYREAQMLYEQTDLGEDTLQNFRQFMLIAVNFNAQKAIDWINEFAKQKKDKQKQFVQFALSMFRETINKNFGAPQLNISSDNPFIEKFSKFITLNNYEKLVDEFNSAYSHIERNANIKILFMDLCLKTNGLLNLK